MDVKVLGRWKYFVDKVFSIEVILCERNIFSRTAKSDQSKDTKESNQYNRTTRYKSKRERERVHTYGEKRHGGKSQFNDGFVIDVGGKDITNAKKKLGGKLVRFRFVGAPPGLAGSFLIPVESIHRAKEHVDHQVSIVHILFQYTKEDLRWPRTLGYRWQQRRGLLVFSWFLEASTPT